MWAASLVSNLRSLWFNTTYVSSPQHLYLYAYGAQTAAIDLIIIGSGQTMDRYDRLFRLEMPDPYRSGDETTAWVRANYK